MFGVTPKDYAIGKEHWLTSKLDVLSSIDYTLQTVDLPSDEVSELITVPELLQLIQNAINITHNCQIHCKNSQASHQHLT